MAKSSGKIVNTLEAIHPRVVKVRYQMDSASQMAPLLLLCWLLIVDGGDDNECLSWLDSQPSQSIVFPNDFYLYMKFFLMPKKKKRCFPLLW